MKKAIVMIVLLTPFIRIINGYIGFFGDLVQIAFLGLFFIWFFFNKHDFVFFTIYGVLFLQIVCKTYFHGFSSEYFKLIVLVTIVQVSLTKDFTELIKQALCRKKLIHIYLFLLNVILFVLTKLDSSYYQMYGTLFFKGSMVHPHTMAYLCVYIVLFVIVASVLNRKKVFLIYMLVPIYCLDLTGVRTVAVALALAGFTYLFLNMKTIKSIMAGFAVVLAGIVAVFTVFKDSMIVQKFLVADSDSGRSSFWKIDLLTYMDFNIIDKFLGTSYEHLQNVNFQAYGIKIGAHNDLLAILFMFGLIGILFYLYLLGFYCIHIRIEFALLLLTLVVMNGFYSYSEIVYVLPLLTTIQKKVESKKEVIADGLIYTRL